MPAMGKSHPHHRSVRAPKREDPAVAPVIEARVLALRPTIPRVGVRMNEKRGNTAELPHEPTGQKSKFVSITKLFYSQTRTSTPSN